MSTVHSLTPLSPSTLRFKGYARACLRWGRGPQVGKVTRWGWVTRLSIYSLIWSLHLPCKRNEIKIRDYMDRRVTPPTWSPSLPCEQAMRLVKATQKGEKFKQGCDVTEGRALSNCVIHALAFMWAVACFYSCRGILCIHPSFRIIGLAEPPVVGGSSQQQWLNSELLSMFLFHHVRPLSKQEEAQVIYEMVNKLETLHGGIGWENSRYFATSPLVSPRIDVWGTSAEIPSISCVTTQIREVLLIGWGKFPSRHDQS